MDIRLIASIRGKNDKLIGLRLLDVDTNKNIDTSIESVIKAITSGTKVEGIAYDNNSIVWTNGSIERYSSIKNGLLSGKSSLVILEQITNGNNTIGYKVCDWNGNMLKLPLNDVIRYGKDNGIANGCLKNINGTTIVSSIAGEYKKMIHMEEWEFNTERENLHTEAGYDILTSYHVFDLSPFKL